MLINEYIWGDTRATVQIFRNGKRDYSYRVIRNGLCLDAGESRPIKTYRECVTLANAQAEFQAGVIV